MEGLEVIEWEESAASSIMNAPTYGDRLRRYSEVYDRDNEFWLRKHGRAGISGRVAEDHAFLRKVFSGAGPLLDIGGGSGRAGEAFPLSREYVVCDASKAALEFPGAEAETPLRKRVLGFATELPFSDGVFEGVMILDVLEHLHADDIVRCLAEARRVLRPGGTLLLGTPNRLSGPWDARRDHPAAHRRLGLHLNELTVRDSMRLVRQAGFKPVASSTRLGSLRTPWAWTALVEGAAPLVPWRLRPRLCPLAIVVARKPE